jgi:hypothetical protein
MGQWSSAFSSVFCSPESVACCFSRAVSIWMKFFWDALSCGVDFVLYIHLCAFSFWRCLEQGLDAQYL